MVGGVKVVRAELVTNTDNHSMNPNDYTTIHTVFVNGKTGITFTRPKQVKVDQERPRDERGWFVPK
ncbi:MAG: hypothetical protein FWE45_00425 [Firmicutes bacterium]|nr:hypothetical protein [Bacillota bacterium]